MNLKSRILLGIAIFIIGSAGIFFWLKAKLDVIEEDTNNSIALSENIKTLFKSGIPNYSYEPREVDWSNNFLVLEGASNANFDVMYRTEINKLLGTDINFPGNNISKLIVLINGSLVKGIYEGTSVKAEQLIYELNYFDLETERIIKIDTVFGPLPNEYIRGNDRKGFVDFPSNEDIVTKIKESLK